jgi:hypothetical protein
MKPEKDNGTSRNRAVRLLEEVRAEHATFSADLRERLSHLSTHHEQLGTVFGEHHESLARYGETLNGIKDQLTHLQRGQEEQTGMLREYMQKLEAASVDTSTPTLSRSTRKADLRAQGTQETTMSDTMHDTDNTSDKPELQDWRSISWSSVLFGTLAALAIGVMLHILGIGITASSVDGNTQNASDAAATVGGVAGIWFLIGTAIALFIGGFLASTLAHTFTGPRATTYGLGVWALASLISLAVIVPAVVKGTGNALNAAGSIADRAGSALGTVGGAAAQAGQNAPAGGLLDRLQRTLIGNTNGQVDQNAAQEITSLVGQRVTQGEWTPQQRDQLIAAVARAANINQDDARRRVDEAQNTINYNIQQAQEKIRQAAEATRKAVSGAAYYIFGAMLIGLLASVFGARYGELDENELPQFARIRFQPRRMQNV